MSSPVLQYPEYGIVGATDVAAMALFFSAFGMIPLRSSSIPAEATEALYGATGPATQVIMHTPGSNRRIRIVQTSNAALPFEPLVAGPYGLDYFSRDLDVTIGMVKAAGGHNFTPLVGYGSEPTKHPDADPHDKNYEILFQGPDELTVYVTDINQTPRRYASLLDADDTMINSELIMLCWVIGNTGDLERKFWEEEVGVDVVGDGYPDNADMVELMYHPRPTPTRCLNITDTERNTKIEIMSYPEEEVKVPQNWPLRGGLFAGGFSVSSVEAAIADLPSATFGQVVTFNDPDEGMVTAVTGTSPSGVRFELRSRS